MWCSSFYPRHANMLWRIRHVAVAIVYSVEKSLNIKT